MSKRRISTVIYFIVFMFIFVACDAEQGMMHGSRSFGMYYWNWPQILISLFLGFVLGLLVCKRRK